LFLQDCAVLDTLFSATSLWELRIAILATQAFIRAGYFAGSLRLSTFSLSQPYDFMHKACGRMLREVGKRDIKPLWAFLAPRAACGWPARSARLPLHGGVARPFTLEVEQS
jgi:3-methyladenine DNA glycosylase AlkD